ncbi:MAG: AAA family ATPase [Bacteroidota bacterium]
MALHHNTTQQHASTSPAATAQSTAKSSETNQSILTLDPHTRHTGLLVTKPIGHWLLEAKARPMPQQLLSEFWFEEELYILFADSNVGKSILAMQIGNSISQGVPIPGFALGVGAQKILYCDFELSDKQLEVRYSATNEEQYPFVTDNFLRAEITPDPTLPPHCSFEAYLYDSLKKVLVQSQAKVLIIDNLTYLKNETEKANHALTLMKQLQKLKKQYQLSILALAHTPKRDFSRPISCNDLQGSKMLMNFCDSAFSIGRSQQDTGLRYLKQIKARNVEVMYGVDHVCLCEIVKPTNFLHFRFLDYTTEQLHLR